MYQAKENIHHLILIIIISPFFNQIKLIKIETSFTRVTWPRKAAVHLTKETDKQQITKLINIQYKVLSNLPIKM